MQCAQRNCKNSFVRKIKEKTSAFPVLTGILIAILPKCPFCIAAYSSAMVLCSGTKIYNQSPDWSNFISIALAGITLLMVLLNFRGKRTWVSAALIILGAGLIIKTELYTGELDGYYYGSIVLLLGVWVNGSFLSIFQKWIKPLFRLFHISNRKQGRTLENTR